MGEIIKFNFGGKNTTEGEKALKKILKSDISSELGSLGIEMSDNVISGESAKKIKQLSVSASTLRDQRELVKTYTPQELKKRIEDSCENDWRQKPAFFRAIIDELENRGSLFM